MVTGRREFLKFAGGSLVGLGLSPVPWKLLDDTSIWTQNWSWTPKVPRGEITFHPSACTLCARGCAVQVRCASSQPVGIVPEKGSALCAFGFTAHQAAYHPARLHGSQSDIERAIAFVKAALRAGRKIAIVDPAPGRVASTMYRRFAAESENVFYMADPEPRTLRAYEKLAGLPYRSVGADLAGLRTIVAVDAPVLEDWGSPGLLMRRRSNVRVIYSGTMQGTTAELADEHVGLTQIAMIAGRLEKPALVIGGEHLPWPVHVALARLNRDLGGLTFRREVNDGAVPSAIPSIPDGSIDVLIVDGVGLPLSSLRSKLKARGSIVAVSAFANEYTSAATLVVPAPAPLESIQDLATAFDSPASSLRIAPAVTTSHNAIPMADLIARIGGGESYEHAIDARIETIHTAGKGVAKGLKLDDFRTAVKSGTPWLDDAVPMPDIDEHAAPPPEEPAREPGRRLLVPPPLLASLRTGATA